MRERFSSQDQAFAGWLLWLAIVVGCSGRLRCPLYQIVAADVSRSASQLYPYFQIEDRYLTRAELYCLRLSNTAVPLTFGEFGQKIYV